ncbi:GDSL-type esterase/lipase family protein [Paludibaculum fermentans]|uniref:GDSL-type esterase/lipase family protein n=1 Tax=Paludibaculum fermentans TaxID=1473598 RepID=UPI003EBAEE15
MKLRSRPSLKVGLLLAFCAIAGTAQTPATLPTDRLNEPWWAKRHAAVLEKVQSEKDTELILLGDSITQNYEKADPPDEDFQPTWRHFYSSRKALNLGFSGDTTAHVLWRLEHGEVDGLRPRAVVLLIGTNNTARGQSAEETSRGIESVVAKLREKLPQSAILLLGLLPSEVSPEKSGVDAEVNRRLARRYESEEMVAYLDISPAFFQDNRLNTAIFYDPRLKTPRKPLHPDTTGQRLMAEAIEPTLTRLMEDGPRQYLAGLSAVNTALIPVPRLERDSYDWDQRHRDVLAAKSQIEPEIVLVGDSITHFWGGLPKANHVNGPNAWAAAFGGTPVLNLGFGWDRTQNVLWRLQHGEFDGLHPKTVILNIGTNNLTGTVNARANTPEEVVQGILAIHEKVRASSPGSRLVVMGIFPRGFSPSARLRAPIARVNQLLAAALAGKPDTTFLDIGARFLQPDGTLPKRLMNDGTHPTEEGYAIWVQALAEAGVIRPR